MKKHLSILFVFALMLLFSVQSVAAVDWENVNGNPDDQTDMTGDGRYDLTFDSSTNITGTEITFFVPDLDANTSLRIDYMYNSGIISTVYPSYVGFATIDLAVQFPSNTINRIRVIYYSSMVHMYNSTDYGEINSYHVLSQDEDLYYMINYHDDENNNDEYMYSRGWSAGVNSVWTNYDLIVDEDLDGYDDVSYEQGEDDGYAVGIAEELDFGVFTNTLSSMGGIFTMEIFPGVTIGLLASIPIAFGLFKWFLKIVS